VVRVSADCPAACTSIQVVAWLSGGTTCRRSAISPPIPLLLVFLMGAAMAIVTIPEQIERLCGVRVDSEEFVSRSDRQLRLILAHLAGSRPAGAGAQRPDESAGDEADNGHTE
jgi:hypothetical protein